MNNYLLLGIIFITLAIAIYVAMFYQADKKTELFTKTIL